MVSLTRIRKRIEVLLKRQHVTDPPIPIEEVAKSLGAQVRRSPLDEELSGMIYVRKGTPIIGVNSRHHPNRQRFTIAHEIAHLILHRDSIVDQIHVDRKFPVLMRDANSATGTERMEIEANRFAAELLMPTFLLSEVLKTKGFDIDDEETS